MIEQRSSDPMSEKENASDEEIIDLTDEVPPESQAEDEDIIELTMEAEPASDDEDILELTMEAEPDEEEEILELTMELEPAAGDEEILELTTEIEPSDEDEEILELTAEATPAEDEEEILELSLEAEPSMGNEDILSSASEAELPAGEEDILPLTEEAEVEEDDAIGELMADAEAAGSESPSEAGPLQDVESMQDQEEDLFRLLDDEAMGTPLEETMHVEPAVDDDGREDDAEQQLPETKAAETDGFDMGVPGIAIEESLPQKDVDLASVLGVRLDPARDLSLEPIYEGYEVDVKGLSEECQKELPSFVIPRDLLESAVGRAVETRLAEKIDGLLNIAIEKAVKAEISRLKRLLAEDFPDPFKR